MSIDLAESLNERPLITVGIPTFNGGQGVRKAMASVLAQEYDNIEILISDNASTDNTEAICFELFASAPNKVKCFRHDKNIGMLANFEFLLQKAKGKYFMWLADDDSLTPAVLDKYVDFLQMNPTYGLVSGIIEYKLSSKDAVAELEHGFNFDQTSPFFRVVGYYYKVVHGAMYHGLMRTHLAQQIDVRKVIGNDWHFVANMAFLGKIRNLDFVSYQKKFGGSSRTFFDYANLIGDSAFAGRYPHLKIAMDAYKEIRHRSSVYSGETPFKRFITASFSFLAVTLGYYAKIYPRVIGGRIKRSLKRTIEGIAYVGD